MEKTIEKINKLLRLAKSDNVHEAKAAMLKARELMVLHNLNEEDIYESPEDSVKHIETTITFTRRSEPWVPFLANVMAENFRCMCYESSGKWKQKRTIGFIGKQEDIDICVMVFEYAVDCIHKEMDIIKKQKKRGGYRYNPELYVGYGMGYVSGIREAFIEQTETHSDDWGLVVSVPEEVTKYTEKNFKTVSHKPPSCIETMSEYAFSDGEKDGKTFNPFNRLTN